MKSVVSVDFFTVPTIRFEVLYVFLMLAHDRRRILHVAVSAHPTAEWAAQAGRGVPGGRERSPPQSNEPPNYIRPVGETEGAAMLAAGQSPAAKAAFERALAVRPHSGG